MNKILVIDDEQNIRELIKFNLESEGYEVITAADGQTSLDKADDTVDLIVLDLMLPEIDGLSVCRKIRNSVKYNKIPIIMLTAKGEEVDRILGLEMGADDYLTKPFSPRELIARIKAILRRVKSFNVEMEDANIEEILQGNGLELNIASHVLKKDGKEIDLTPKEFDLLKLLISNPSRVFTREILLEKIWGYEYSGDTRTVDVHVRRLRKKLGDNYITTIRGVGYKFV